VCSRREIPAVQVAGYRLLGVSLIICGVALFAAVLHSLGGPQLGITELLVLILAGAMTTAFLWYGWYLIKQGARYKR
jgi:drug/metabolite transporter (DMT)-like permease